jgi:hypothetical protein
VLSGGLVRTGEAVRAGAKTSFPDDFIGPAAAGGWEAEFGDRDRQAFDAFAGDLLIELGMSATTRGPGASRGVGSRSWPAGRLPRGGDLPCARSAIERDGETILSRT